jgi:hypothetical protein
MSCENVQERISLLLDGQVAAAEREYMLAHTVVCRECGTHLEALQTQRALLRKMAQAPVPVALDAKLRVLASHERERQLARISVRERVRRMAANVNLAFDNLARPVALPLTGGLVSALLLFGLMMPTLNFARQTGGYEFTADSTVPRGSIVTTPWGQQVDRNAVDFPFFASPNQPKSDYVNIVNLTIDESGRVVDWTIVRGQLTDEMKSIIVLGRFDPATADGVNTSGTIQVRQSLPPCKYTRCTNNNSVTVRG